MEYTNCYTIDGKIALVHILFKISSFEVHTLPVYIGQQRRAVRRTPAKKGKKAQTAVVCGGLGNALGTGKETLLMKIGFWELVVVVIVAFVFIGPDQLPVYAKKLGKMLRELKKYTGAASEEIQKNVVEPLNEIQAPLKEAVAPLTDIKKDIDSSMRDVTKSFTGIGKTSKEEAAKKLEFIEAAQYRDELLKLEDMMKERWG